MKKILFIIASMSLTACNLNENGSENIGFGPAHNYQIPTTIDSLRTVDELLNYLETFPATPLPSQEGSDDTEHTWVGDNGEPFKE